MKNTKELLAFALLTTGLLVMASAPVAAQEVDSDAATDEAVDTTMEEVVEEPPIITLSGNDPSVPELREQISLPPSARLEIQEDPANPKSLFQPDQLKQIFSDKPRFIYYPEGVDPMLIPWVRERVMAEELYAQGQVAESNRDYEKAQSIYAQVMEKFPNTAQAAQAALRADEVKRLIAGLAAADENGEVPIEQGPVELPTWVAANTTAVMIKDSPVVLVENDFLREGDFVPKYASVRVKKITPSEVVYLYQDEEFAVPVSGNPQAF